MSHIVSTWDEFFMEVALAASRRSKDPNTQVGACIADQNNRIVGVGYNGLPYGFNDKEFQWNIREGNFLDTKYPYVVHAEPNAILNCFKRPDDCVLYVTLYPCNECAKFIVQSGIKKIVYLDDKYRDTDYAKAASIIFKLSLVETVKFGE